MPKNRFSDEEARFRPLFLLWSHRLAGGESKDFDMRLEMTRAFLKNVDCKEAWTLSYPTDDRLENQFDDGEERVGLSALMLEVALTQMTDTTFHKPEIEGGNSQLLSLAFEPVQRLFELLTEHQFSSTEDLSEQDVNRLELYVRARVGNLSRSFSKPDPEQEKQFIQFIEWAGLFKDVNASNGLDLAESATESQAKEILRWAFRKGLSPDVRIPHSTHHGQAQDDWPFASLTPTLDVLDVFVSEGANLAQESKNGTAFSELIAKRTSSWSNGFATTKDREQVTRAVYKAEAASQKDPQKQLWNLIKKASRASDAATAVRSFENASELRDEKGRHVVQFVMTRKPDLTNAVLSVNKKIAGLVTVPDEKGRPCGAYWVASGSTQTIQGTQQTAALIPRSIDEKTWKEAAELSTEIGFASSGLCSNQVRDAFKRTTGKHLGEWLESEVAQGYDWFEQVLQTATERTRNAANKTNGMTFHDTYTPEKDEESVTARWADPSNAVVVSKPHAIFRAHLVLAEWIEKNKYQFPFNAAYGKRDTSAEEKKRVEKVESFLKKHTLGKEFETLKEQLNEKTSFMSDDTLSRLLASQWWKETCATMERDGLLKKHVRAVKSTHAELGAL